ncbi:MAG: efflux RND transporter periplasmic adaptor subunit [Xanthomonadaceae bacterium]|nr:efflux RND transporter periplasmic adaptor subunit [Xanthomonadaceae bacterium]
MRITRRGWGWGIGLGAVALGLLAWAFAPRPLPVEVATATIGAFEASIDEEARTRVRDRYVVSAPLAGRLARIALREGDAVKAGDVVATLAPALSPMLDTRTEAELRARVETADAMVSRARSRIDRARVGVDQARSTLRRDEALARDRFVSASQLDTDRLALRAAERELESAQEDRHVADHEVEQARAALSAARNPDGDDASAFVLRAPVSGRVLRVAQASEGMVALGTPLLDIGDLADMEVVAELLTTDALKTPPGTPVRIERWGGEGRLDGRVRRVEPAAFTKVSALGVEEQRVRVLIDLLDPPARRGALGDGYRVGVRAIVQARDGVLIVPAGAVFPHPDDTGNAPDRMALFVVRDGRARQVLVELGGRNGREAWIAKGLAPGDQVIVYPGEEVADGRRVRARSTTDR